MKVKIGDWIRIIEMEGNNKFNGKIGYITEIDDLGQIHGTWGGCALIPSIDRFIIIDKSLIEVDD